MQFSIRTVHAMLLVFLACARSAHGLILDQSHDVNLHTSYAAWAIADDRSAYQTFTAGLSGTLSRVDLGVFRESATVAPLQISIWEVGPSGGLSNLLSTSALPASFIPLSGGFEVFSLTAFSATTSIVAGQAYAIHLTSAAPNDPPYQSRFNWVYDEAGYPGGLTHLDWGTGFFAVENSDFLFATYVTPIPEPAAYAFVLGATALLMPWAKKRGQRGWHAFIPRFRRPALSTEPAGATCSRRTA